MGCLGWLLFGPFILAWYILVALGAAAVAITRAITGTVREIRPEPTERQLDRRARRQQIAGIVLLAVCVAVAAAMIAAAL